MTTVPVRPLRADAARNRERILTAAREVFAVHGLRVNIDEVARHAGLGVGTLYRRFPDRESLIAALFEQRMRDAVDDVRAALEEPDPWQALLQLIELVCSDIASDRGMRQAILTSVLEEGAVGCERQKLAPLLAQLVSRAQASGRLREGFSETDIPVLFLMIGSVADFAGDTAPELWRRYLHMFFEGMRAGPPEVRDGGSPLGEDQLTTAMAAWEPTRR